MGHTHEHGAHATAHEGSLWWALGLTGIFLLVEIAGGLLTNSLALLSDAAHMATDTAGLVIALAAVRLSRRPPDARRTFGFARVEALGALANGVLLMGVAGYILWEAAERFRDPPAVAATGMLVVAVAGLIVNLVAMRILARGSSESLNVKGAYLEVWSDMLGSLGVLITAVAIRMTGWLVLDPILAVLIGLWVLPRTWSLLHEAVNVLLEGAPHGTDVAAVRAAILGHAGVIGVHDLHVWALRSKQPILAAHVVASEDSDPEALRRDLNGSLHASFGIAHSTLQVETVHCGTQDCDPAVSRPA